MFWSGQAPRFVSAPNFLSLGRPFRYEYEIFSGFDVNGCTLPLQISFEVRGAAWLFVFPFSTQGCLRIKQVEFLCRPPPCSGAPCPHVLHDTLYGRPQLLGQPLLVRAGAGYREAGHTREAGPAGGQSCEGSEDLCPNADSFRFVGQYWYAPWTAPY